MAHHNRRSRLLPRFCTCHRTCAAWLGGRLGGGREGRVVVDGEMSVGATVSGLEGSEVGPGQVGRKAKAGGKQQSRSISNFWFEYRPRGNHA